MATTTTTETKAEALQLIRGLLEGHLSWWGLVSQQIADTLDEHGLLSEDIGPGRTLKYTEEWGLLLCADDPADAEIIPFETRTEIEQEMKDYREAFARGTMDANAYEPMKIVRRLVPIRPKPPWDEVE